MRHFAKLSLILILAGGACASEEPSGPTGSSERPNIVFIMTDDHAEQAISAYGGTLIETPNIDRLAKEGMRFENSFVTNSICAPSRAVMLTGKYSHLNGLRDNLDEFDGSQQTFPKLLQEAGYQTAMIGKWHLKTEPTGFDFWKVLIGQGEYYNPEFIEMGRRVQPTGYVTDLITDFALGFLDSRDPERPFALLYHHKAPHRNWMPEPDHFALYQDRDLPLPETFYDDYSGRPAAEAADMRVADMFLSGDMKLKPESFERETGTGGNTEADFDPVSSWMNSYGRLTAEQKEAWDAFYDPVNREFHEAELSGKALAEWKYQRYIKDYLRCVASVDENIGRLLDYLDESGLTQNTIVVYTSDQGFYLGEHGWYDKRFMYEESHATPLIVRFPPEVSAGQVSEELVLNLDFAPTFLDMAGVSVPAEMQGRSLRPILQGEEPQDWRDAVYYHYYEYPHGWHKVKRHYGIRTDRYKLIHFYDDIDVWELYDLEQDPHELNNLYGREAYGEIQSRLHVRLEELQSQYGDPIETSGGE